MGSTFVLNLLKSLFISALKTQHSEKLNLFFFNLVVQVAFLAVLVEHLATLKIDEQRSDKKSNIENIFLCDNSDSISSLPIIVIFIFPIKFQLKLTYFKLLVSFYTP